MSEKAVYSLVEALAGMETPRRGLGRRLPASLDEVMPPQTFKSEPFLGPESTLLLGAVDSPTAASRMDWHVDCAQGPLWVSGARGSGRTHLLRVALSEIRTRSIDSFQVVFNAALGDPVVDADDGWYDDCLYVVNGRNALDSSVVIEQLDSQAMSGQLGGSPVFVLIDRVDHLAASAVRSDITYAALATLVSQGAFYRIYTVLTAEQPNERLAGAGAQFVAFTKSSDRPRPVAELPGPAEAMAFAAPSPLRKITRHEPTDRTPRPVLGRPGRASPADLIEKVTDGAGNIYPLPTPPIGVRWLDHRLATVGQEHLSVAGSSEPTRTAFMRELATTYLSCGWTVVRLCVPSDDEWRPEYGSSSQYVELHDWSTETIAGTIRDRPAPGVICIEKIDTRYVRIEDVAELRRAIEATEGWRVTASSAALMYNDESTRNQKIVVYRQAIWLDARTARFGAAYDRRAIPVRPGIERCEDGHAVLLESDGTGHEICLAVLQP